MKKDTGIFDGIVKVFSVLFLILGVVLLLYIFVGPSLGLIDAESAGFTVGPAILVILFGIVSVALSFTGHTKASAVGMVLLVAIIGFNVWNESRLSLPGIPTTAGGVRLNSQPAPPVPGQ